MKATWGKETVLGPNHAQVNYEQKLQKFWAEVRSPQKFYNLFLFTNYSLVQDSDFGP